MAFKKNSSCKHSADRVSGLVRHVEFPLKKAVRVLYHIEFQWRQWAVQIYRYCTASDGWIETSAYGRKHSWRYIFLIGDSFFMAQQANWGPGRPIVEDSRWHTFRHIHTHTQTHTRQVSSDGEIGLSHKLPTQTHTTDEHSCPQRDSSPRWQKSNSFRPLP